MNTPMTAAGKKDSRHTVLYGPLVQAAIHASDKFSMIVRNGTKYLDRLKSTLRLLQQRAGLIRFSAGEPTETLLHFAARAAHDEACEIILQSRWCIEEINKPATSAGRTPLLESVRLNRRAVFHLLRKYGAEVQALALSPYDENARVWSALHIFADQAHNDNSRLLDDILEAGPHVDADGGHHIETPFNVAVPRNAFKLANHLQARGSSINATSTKSSLLGSPHPLTGLGHIIALNARHSFSGLRYMLSLRDDAEQRSANFIVKSARSLTALDLCADVPHGLIYASGESLSPEHFDWETNRAIAHELLE